MDLVLQHVREPAGPLPDMEPLVKTEPDKVTQAEAAHGETFHGHAEQRVVFGTGWANETRLAASGAIVPAYQQLTTTDCCRACGRPIASSSMQRQQPDSMD